MNEHSKALLYLPLLPASTQKKLHTAKCDNLQQPSAHIHPSSTVGLGGLNNFVCRLWHLAGIKEQHNNVSTWEISSADIDCLRCFTDQSQLCITVPQFFSQVSFRCLTGDVTPHGSEWEHAFFPAVKWLKGLNNSEKRKWCSAKTDTWGRKHWYTRDSFYKCNPLDNL